MTPDKIYVMPSTFMELGYIDVVCKNKKGIEYIRKDALMEWLQKEYDTNKWFYDIHAKPNELHIGRCEAYKQVIDKIKSL